MPVLPSEPLGTPDPNAPAPASSNTTGLDSNIAALVAWLFPLIGGLVFVVLEKKDRFVRFWAMQCIFLGSLLIGISVIVWIAMLIFGLIPILGKLMIGLLGLIQGIFGVIWLIVYVIGAVNAFSRREWEVPWLGKLARQQLARMDAATPPA
jgi:uncharacterized membrane protein